MKTGQTGSQCSLILGLPLLYKRMRALALDTYVRSVVIQPRMAR